METKNKLIFNCFIIGIFAIFIGLCSEKILKLCKKPNNCLTKMKNNFTIFIVTLFVIGIVIHLFSVFIGLEAYCEKKCIDNNCNYVCSIKMPAF
jgi:hypothetical protein